MSVKRLLASSFVAVFTLCVATAAVAQEERPPERDFGETRRFALSLNHGLFVNVADLISGDELQASYFFAPNVSIGLAVGVQWMQISPTNNSVNGTSLSASGNSQNLTVLHLGPRLGYDIHLSNFVSIWPQIGVDYRRLDASSTSISSVSPGGVSSSTTNTTTSSAVGFTAIAPILIHPAKGFFVGAGPAFYADLSNSTSEAGQSVDNSKITSIGVMATLGGAF
jgi:hypothetical protein